MKDNRKRQKIFKSTTDHKRNKQPTPPKKKNPTTDVQKI